MTDYEKEEFRSVLGRLYDTCVAQRDSIVALNVNVASLTTTVTGIARVLSALADLKDVAAERLA